MTTTPTPIATVRMTPDAFVAEFGIDHAKAQGRGVCHDDGSDTIEIYDHELAARISLAGYDVEYCETHSGMRYYIKHRAGGDHLLKVIDADNNYSVQSLSDQEPDGYVDHQWGTDAADWREVTREAAQAAGFRVVTDDVQTLENGLAAPADATFRLSFDGWEDTRNGGVTSHIDGYNVYDYIDIDAEYESEHAALAAMRAVKADRDGIRPVLTLEVA